MFKCAFLGCGPRAKGHARGYQFVKRGQMVALCDLNEERLNQFGDEFGVATRYTDVHEMLEREQPDVLHIVTLPALRLETLTIAAEHNVPAVIIEKPIALDGADYKAIRALAASSPMKICVNTQLNFHAHNMELKQAVAEGAIGQVRFIDASARSTPLDQGVHVLELAHSYAAFSPITAVFGQVAGADQFDSRQPAPSACVGNVSFESGVKANLVCGRVAPYATEHRDVIYFHKRVAAYGTEGYVSWSMGGWEKFTAAGGYQSGPIDYRVEDDPAQGRLTEAMFDWLLDESKPHPTRIERSLAQFGAILGLYTSSLTCAPVDLPFDPPDNLLEQLRPRL